MRTMRKAAISLIVLGIAAVVVWLVFPFWQHLLMPPRSEWRDSLPGLGRTIFAFKLLASVAAIGLGLGSTLLLVDYLRGRRRPA